MSAARKPPAARHCRITPAHWSQYLDGEFSSAECRRCETHLKECEACRAQLQGLRLAVSACRTAGVTTVPAAVKAAARRRARALLSPSRR